MFPSDGAVRGLLKELLLVRGFVLFFCLALGRV